MGNTIVEPVIYHSNEQQPYNMDNAIVEPVNYHSNEQQPYNMGNTIVEPVNYHSNGQQPYNMDNTIVEPVNYRCSVTTYTLAINKNNIWNQKSRMFIFPYEKLDLIGTMEALHFNVSVCW